MNANLSLNAMNHEVIPINTKVISGKVYDAKSITTKNMIPKTMVAKCMTTMNSRTNNDEIIIIRIDCISIVHIHKMFYAHYNKMVHSLATLS